MPAVCVAATNGDRLQQLATAGDIAGCGGHIGRFFTVHFTSTPTSNLLYHKKANRSQNSTIHSA